MRIRNTGLLIQKQKLYKEKLQIKAINSLNLEQKLLTENITLKFALNQGCNYKYFKISKSRHYDKDKSIGSLTRVCCNHHDHNPHNMQNHFVHTTLYVNTLLILVSWHIDLTIFLKLKEISLSQKNRSHSVVLIY